MTVDEAIKNLSQWLKNLQHDKLPDYHESLRLGIEALKREQYHRSCNPTQSPNLLPGETE